MRLLTEAVTGSEAVGGKTMRERLIELIADARNEYYDYSDELHEEGMSVPESSEEYIADYLLANGVVVMPCKVGDVVYMWKIELIREPQLCEFIIRKIQREENAKGTYNLYCADNGQMAKVFDDNDIGKTVFLTREDAERALKGETK